MTKHTYIIVAFLLALATQARAQAVIGAEATEPQEFSVLEIISNNTKTGGLRLPQLTTEERETLTNTPEFQAAKDVEARGLTIYNKETDCIEFWNGEQWISTCAGESCPTPAMPEAITFSKPGPLRLNETFTAEVPTIAGLTYTWTVPASFVLEGTSVNDNPITLRAVTPGIHSLYNIGVTATNDCGNTGASRPGSGYIQVLNCETEPQLADIDLRNIVSTLTDGDGSSGNPYKVYEGNSFTLSYTDTGSGMIKFNFNLNQEGSEFFSIITHGNGTILLTAKSGKDGETCSGEAIGIIASNDCGDSQRKASEIFIKIVAGGTCPKPDAPDEIIFSKTTVLVNEIFTARVATPDAVMTYTWSVPEGLQVVGSNIGNPISLRAKNEGTINLVGVSVTATNNCGNTSDPTNGAGILTVRNPSNIPEGPGNLQGRTCFDIAYSNSGGSCGEPTGRQSNRTDFSIRTEQDPVAGYVGPPYSGIQVYSFTPPANVVITNLRYIVEDPSGLAVDKYETKPGNEYKLVVHFKPSLNETLKGLTRENALKVHIYAIYEEGGSEKSVKLTASLQDCACCGAKVANGRWLNFMCHNLGANESLPPFEYNAGLKGHLYQWGRRSDNHELRNSSKVSGPADQSRGELDANGQVVGQKTGQFLMFVYGRKIVSDWRTPSDGELWKDNVKTANDPCPPGWKVPSAAQWRAVINNNNWVWTGKGRKIGDALYLPAAGSRSARPGTSITSDPESSVPNYPQGYYWSSTAEYNTYWQTNVAYELGFRHVNNPYVSTNEGITYRNWGQSVRCVEDLP